MTTSSDPRTWYKLDGPKEHIINSPEGAWWPNLLCLFSSRQADFSASPIRGQRVDGQDACNSAIGLLLDAMSPNVVTISERRKTLEKEEIRLGQSPNQQKLRMAVIWRTVTSIEGIHMYSTPFF